MSAEQTTRIEVNPLPTTEEWRTWDKEELELQMTPSRWAENSEEILNQFIRIGQQETEEARKILSHELDIPYGPLPSQKLDVYGTDLDESSDVFFWIHGGYWQEGSKDISANFSVLLRKLGLKTVVFGYTLAPSVTIPEIQEEVVLAVNFALKKYPSSSFYIGGHSAGGQLAVSILLKDASTFPGLSDRLKGLFFVSGVYDLRPLVDTSINMPLKLTEEAAQKLSALFNQLHPSWLDARKLRNFVIVGRHDPPEFRRQSQAFADQLKEILPTDFWISPEDDHFSIINNLGVESSAVAQKLVHFLRPQ